MIKPPPILSHKDPFFGLRILQPSEDSSLPPKRILNYKDGTELVYIPPGPFGMGDGKKNSERTDCPRHEVTLDGFYMAVWPVTNKQYRRFIRETGHRAPDGADAWEKGRLNPGYMEHPVVCVNWEDAEAYASWATLRLPSEAEWEKAAGGPDGLIYPWGNEWDAARCRNSSNSRPGTTAEVKEYVSGVSAYGCEQMSGNVWEWCSDWYGLDAYREVVRRNPKGPEKGFSRVSRGGSWISSSRYARVANRNGFEPSGCHADRGFRVARSFP